MSSRNSPPSAARWLPPHRVVRRPVQEAFRSRFARCHGGPARRCHTRGLDVAIPAPRAGCLHGRRRPSRALAAYTIRRAGAARAATSGPRAPAVRLVSADGRPGPCSRSRPCATLGAAYLSAPLGRTIVTIAPGHYPVQTIDADPTLVGRRTGVVSYRPETPGTVDLEELIVDAPDLEVSNVQTAGWSIHPAGSRVTLRNVESTSAIYVDGAQNVRILGGSVSSVGRPLVNGSEVKAVEGSSAPPRNVLFNGVSFHDMLRAPGSSYHVDCLHVMAVDGLIVRRSRLLELRGLRHPVHRLRRCGIAPQRAAREQLLRVLQLGLLLRPAGQRPRRAVEQLRAAQQHLGQVVQRLEQAEPGRSGSSGTSHPESRAPVARRSRRTGTCGRAARAAASTIASRAQAS